MFSFIGKVTLLRRGFVLIGIIIVLSLVGIEWLHGWWSCKIINKFEMIKKRMNALVESYYQILIYKFDAKIALGSSGRSLAKAVLFAGENHWQRTWPRRVRLVPQWVTLNIIRLTEVFHERSWKCCLKILVKKIQCIKLVYAESDRLKGRWEETVWKNRLWTWAEENIFCTSSLI